MYLKLILYCRYQGHVDGFVQGSERQAANGLMVTHVINPVEISIRGSKALAVSISNIISRFEVGGAQYDLTSWVRLVSRLEKTDTPDGGHAWKLLSLECIYIRDGIQPVIPLGEPSTLRFETTKTARSSYKYLSWHVEHVGLEIRNNLPGIDNEKSVQDVMDKNYEWINAN